MKRIMSEPPERQYTFYEKVGKGQSRESIRLSAKDIVSEEMIERYCIPDSLIEEYKEGHKIIIRNIFYGTEEWTILDMFEDRGFKIKRMDLIRENELTRQPIQAVITLESEEVMEEAIREFSGEEVDGNIIKVERAKGWWIENEEEE